MPGQDLHIRARHSSKTQNCMHNLNPVGGSLSAPCWSWMYFCHACCPVHSPVAEDHLILHISLPPQLLTSKHVLQHNTGHLSHCLGRLLQFIVEDC